MLGSNRRVTADFRAEHPNTKDYSGHILDVWMFNKKWKYQGGLPTGGAEAPPQNAGSIPSSPLQNLPTWQASAAVQKAVPDTEAEYPEVLAGDRVVLQKGKGFFRITTVDRVTDKQIHFDGRYHVPKTTYRSWNMLLLRKATTTDLKKFDSEWRDIDGHLQDAPSEPPLPSVESSALPTLSETFYVIRRKSDGTYLREDSFTDEVGLATKHRDTEDYGDQVSFRRGRGIRHGKLQHHEWEWVRVEAVYELAVVPSGVSLAAPTASVEAA
jgi:hypothetical protein